MTKREVKIVTKTDLDLEIESYVNIPRKFVYQAYTDPNIIPHWWGVSKYTTKVVTMDVKVGGKWLFVQTDEKGNDYKFFGEFLELTPIESFTWTFNSDTTDGQAIETTEFYELEKEKTKIIVKITFSSKEARDIMVNMGIKEVFERSLVKIEKIKWSYN